MFRLTHRTLTSLLIILVLLAMSCDGDEGGGTPSPSAFASPALQAQGLLAVANFSKAGPDAQREVDARLTVYDVGTGKAIDLGDVNSSCFSWSPDGKTLAFGGSQKLAVAMFPGGTVRAVDGLPSGTAVNCPGSWAPGGSRFTFVTSTGDGNSLWVADVATGGINRLVAATDTERVGSGGLWLDEDRVLVVMQATDDEGRIVIVDSRTGTVERTFEPNGFVSGISVRADGLIAVGASTGARVADANRVIVLDSQKDQTTPLLDGAIQPMWSPDGGHVLVFQPRYGDGSNLLILLQADCSSPQQLLMEGSATGMGSWATDASRLVIASMDANEHDMTVTTYRWDGKDGLGERLNQVTLKNSYPATFGLVGPQYFGYLLAPAGDHLAVMSPTGALEGNFNETKLFVADLASGELLDIGEVGVFSGVAWAPH
ncbi:MAG: hypothetical protein AB7J35_18400 [Dehalococcoidia bacterium]